MPQDLPYEDPLSKDDSRLSALRNFHNPAHLVKGTGSPKEQNILKDCPIKMRYFIFLSETFFSFELSVFRYIA